MPELTLAALRAVNAEINALPYKAGVEPLWQPITEAGGTCSDYASAKFSRLLELGWPLLMLRLACCYVTDVAPPDNYHAVLLVELEESGTVVLDNRYPDVMAYDLLPYKWDRIQIAGTQNWEMA
tara:strand:+ start:455 stop:826 length:372 start_codon:yes stop_codon:yes gene_type:complete